MARYWFTERKNGRRKDTMQRLTNCRTGGLGRNSTCPGLTSVGRGDGLRESGTGFPVLEVLTPHRWERREREKLSHWGAF